jgi:hypothetical protein
MEVISVPMLTVSEDPQCSSRHYFVLCDVHQMMMTLQNVELLLELNRQWYTVPR